jgi:cold shock CspA family protein
MSEGTVKWFNYQKGYGFIESSEFEENVFLHHTAFTHHDEYIHEGSHVNFTLVAGEKGLKAKDVTLK